MFVVRDNYFYWYWGAWSKKSGDHSSTGRLSRPTLAFRLQLACHFQLHTAYRLKVTQWTTGSRGLSISYSPSNLPTLCVSGWHSFSPRFLSVPKACTLPYGAALLKPMSATLWSRISGLWGTVAYSGVPQTFLSTAHPTLTMAREGTPQHFVLRKGIQNNT
jgi:hypothetical protein